MKWVIKNSNTGLFWKNGLGWVDRACQAEKFNHQEVSSVKPSNGRGVGAL